jgi:hypothetical protein
MTLHRKEDHGCDPVQNLEIRRASGLSRQVLDITTKALIRGTQQNQIEVTWQWKQREKMGSVVGPQTKHHGQPLVGGKGEERILQKAPKGTSPAHTLIVAP